MIDENLNFEVKVSMAEISKKLNIPVIVEKDKDQDIEEDEN
jgi:hypothetical protein